MNDEVLENYLEPGETLLIRRRLHSIILALPVFLILLGISQFTRLALAPNTAIAGWVCIIYGSFLGMVFFQLYRHGQVGLTNTRLLYLEKTPFKPIRLNAWRRNVDFDGMLIRKGAFGGLLGYGNIILTRNKLMGGAIRAVIMPQEIAQLVKDGHESL
jgi:hypothetical protein